VGAEELRGKGIEIMDNPRKFSEDKRIIGTPRYVYFQQMCSEAGLFAVKEAKDKGLPIICVFSHNKQNFINAV